MSGSGDGEIPGDVQAQAMDAAGNFANTLPVEPQYEEPPAPLEIIVPEVPMGDFDSYLAETAEQFQAGEPPPSDAPIGSFVVEDVDVGELQVPLETPQIDLEIVP